MPLTCTVLDLLANAMLERARDSELQSNLEEMRSDTEFVFSRRRCIHWKLTLVCAFLRTLEHAEKLVVREALLFLFLWTVVPRGSTWNHHDVLPVLNRMTRQQDQHHPTPPRRFLGVTSNPSSLLPIWLTFCLMLGSCVCVVVSVVQVSFERKHNDVNLKSESLMSTVV